MSALSREHVLSLLDSVIVPTSNKGLVAMGLVRGLVIQPPQVGFSLEGLVPGEAAERLREQAENILLTLPGITRATVILSAHRPGSAPPAASRKPAMEKLVLPGIRTIMAVASGKGGVGKSTTAVNLALAFARQGLRTGILDADIYGPSVPMMLGISEQRPAIGADKKMIPVQAQGLSVLSIGLLTDNNQPVIWRGPMVMGAIEQMLRDAAWENIDILVIDLPPGTGDAQLTLAQRVPVNGAVIVSTPQDIALLDARKGLKMFERMNVPVWGIIENMATFCCPSCGHETAIFGTGGAEREATAQGVPFLGGIPLLLDIRKAGDDGKQLTDTAPAVARLYDGITARLSLHMHPS